MSCRTTSGGSVSTSLARMVSGLPDKDIQHLFHALKREGEGQPAPSELALTEWRERQQQMLDRATRMTDKRRDALRSKLFRSREEPVPDGEMFYAWSRIEGRARQEAVVRSIETAVDLAPPGSQADQYELGEDGRPVNVMYASYGSNLHRDRFMTYIEGGTPPGSRRNYPGCTDTTEPEFDIPIRYHGGFRAHFALTSSVWRGGIAFMDKTDDDETATALGRAYKLPIGTFDEVVHFENGGMIAKTARPVPLDEVLTTGRSVTGEGAYETMVHIGDYEGMPVLTFTAPFSTKDALGKHGSLTRNKVRLPVMTNKPSAAYCRMIGNGLQETFGIDEVAAADYLRGMPGAEKWSRADLVAILREPEAPAAPAPEKKVGYTSATLPGFSAAHREGSATYMGPSDLKKWVESQHAANGQGRQGFGAANNGPVVSSRWSQIGSDKPDTDGNYLPAVKTYETVSEQEDGVARWAHNLKRAKEKVADNEGMVKYYESKGLSSSAEESRTELERSKAVLAEVKDKHAAAKTQAPASFYPEASAYYPHQWSRMAERAAMDLRVAQAELRAADKARKPSPRRVANLTAKVERITAQHAEAQAKAEQTAAGWQTTAQDSFDAGVRAGQQRSPETSTQRRSPASSRSKGKPSTGRLQPGMRYPGVRTYPTGRDQYDGVVGWQRAVRDSGNLLTSAQGALSNAQARHAAQPSKFSESELGHMTEYVTQAEAKHQEAITKRDAAIAQTPSTYTGNLGPTALANQSNELRHMIVARKQALNANRTTANNPNNGTVTIAIAKERAEDIEAELTVLNRSLAQVEAARNAAPAPAKTTKKATPKASKRKAAQASKTTAPKPGPAKAKPADEDKKSA